MALALFKLTEAQEIISDESKRILYGWSQIPQDVESTSRNVGEISNKLKESIQEIKSYIQTEERY